MATPANAREARLQRRFDKLTSGDAQLIAAQPDPAITAALDGPGVLLTDVIRTVMTGYADRPALGQRAVEFVTDASGRTVAELQPRFDTLTYRETWARVKALADALAGNPVQPGDRVATLGFTSADYAIVDMALSLTGAVAVPLQTSAPVPQLHPILLETEPVAILVQRRPPRRRRRARLDRARAQAPGGVRLPPADRRPPRGVRIRRRAPGRPAGLRRGTRRRHQAGRPAHRRAGDPPRRQRRPATADLHLRQHRHAQGRDVHRPPDGQVLARMVRPRLGHRRQAAGDHVELHAHQPRDGPRHPVLHTGRGRDGLLRRQERPVHPARRPRAGAPDQARPRPPHLGDAVPGGAERGRPPHHRRRRSGHRRNTGDGRAARETHWRTPVLGDDGLRAHFTGAAGLDRGVHRHPPHRGLRLHRGQHRPGRRPDPAPTGDRLQAGGRARSGLLRHRSPASARRVVGQVNGSDPRLLQAPRGDGRTLRRRRLVSHR